MNTIDVDELLKILPKLIRENDTVKGAIISALSGIVATRDDIKDLIREMDKRFEAMDKRFEAMDKRFEAMDKRFEAMQAEMDRRFDGVEKRLDSLETGQKRIEATLIAMQNKTGTELENLVLEVMAATLQLEHIDPGKIRKEMIADVNGEVYHEKYKTDIDVLLEDGNTYLVEVKATADNHDVNTFFNHARLYERLHHVKPTGLLLVALRIKRKHLDYATSLGIRVIAGDIIKE